MPKNSWGEGEKRYAGWTDYYLAIGSVRKLLHVQGLCFFRYFLWVRLFYWNDVHIRGIVISEKDGRVVYACGKKSKVSVINTSSVVFVPTLRYNSSDI